jgi:S1-C subfamily serine protease
MQSHALSRFVARALCVALFLSTFFFCFAHPPQRVIDLAVNSCVKIEVTTVLKPDEWIRMGTGWLLNDQTTVITAKHVADGMDVVSPDLKTHARMAWFAIRAVFQDGDREVVANYKLSQNDDIAVLFLDPKAAKKKHLFCTLAGADPERGAEVTFAGYGLQYDRLLSMGYVSSLIDDLKIAHNKRLVMNCHIIPGQSGSAVLNNDGEVVGIAVSHLVDNDNVSVYMISHAVPVSTMRKELVDLGVKLP